MVVRSTNLGRFVNRFTKNRCLMVVSPGFALLGQGTGYSHRELFPGPEGTNQQKENKWRNIEPSAETESSPIPNALNTGLGKNSKPKKRLSSRTWGSVPGKRNLTRKQKGGRGLRPSDLAELNAVKAYISNRSNVIWTGSFLAKKGFFIL